MANMMSCLRREEAFSICSSSAKESRSAGLLALSSERCMALGRPEGAGARSFPATPEACGPNRARVAPVLWPSLLSQPDGRAARDGGLDLEGEVRAAAGVRHTAPRQRNNTRERNPTRQEKR